jgi:transcriptional regulator with XRE-family HTH domain
MDMNNLGDRIKQVRREKGLTQGQLSELVDGLEQSVLTKIENRSSKSSIYSAGIAKALEVNLTWLQTGEGDKDNSLSASMSVVGSGSASASARMALNADAVSFALRVIKSISVEVQEHSGIDGMASIFIKAYNLSIANDNEREPVNVESFLELIQ